MFDCHLIAGFRYYIIAFQLIADRRRRKAIWRQRQFAENILYPEKNQFFF